MNSETYVSLYSQWKFVEAICTSKRAEVQFYADLTLNYKGQQVNFSPF